ncbi:hypothetical protein SCUCBS95973_003864 [Sporothrix curviconia]|uniref:Uncharacterized protein n=1 Tax=Sporothrix curviconia TaxID=1260050 RepID=A0ABP0BIZ0_9PEZI
MADHPPATPPPDTSGQPSLSMATAAAAIADFFNPVNPVPGYQSLENRFGPRARRRIYANLRDADLDDDDQDLSFNDVADASDIGSNVGEDDSGEDDSSEDSGTGDVNGNDNLPGHGNAGGHSMDVDNDTIGINDDNGDNNANSHSEDGGDSEDGDAMVGDAHDGVPAPASNPTAASSDSTILAGLVASAQDDAPDASGGNTAQSSAAPSSGSSTQHGGTAIPRVARARTNLTALSQQYNLYFAVYQSEIHVFRPQPAPEILRGPLLVLCPPPTAAGRQIGGYISRQRPHQANHVITGDLGGAEILLLAYDDGDVVAYYTRHIVDYLRSAKRRRRRRPAPIVPQPFFRETVGITAWGLAIHSQSRLIAVSSNLAEVNVFAFALQPPTPNDPLQHMTQPLKVPDHDTSPKTYSGFSALELESLLRLRDRHWRILLPLGPTGHNIPCIDFISDTNGNATKVAAIDINGTVFLLDIWKVGSRPMKIPSYGSYGMQLGWGVSVIPTEMFLPTAKMPAPDTRQMLDRSLNPNIDSMLYFSHMNESSMTRPKHISTVHDMTEHEPDLDSDISQDDTGDHFTTANSDEDSGSEAFKSSSETRSDFKQDLADSSDAEHSDGSSVDEDGYEHQRNDSVSSADSTAYANDPSMMFRNWDVLLRRNDHCNFRDGCGIGKVMKTPFRLGMIICPSIGLTWPNLNLQTLIRTLKNARYRLDHSQEENLFQARIPLSAEAKHMSRRFFILRSFSNTIELVNTDKAVPSFFISNVLKPPTRSPEDLWDMGPSYYRCSLLHTIPEINLIIVGNMFGRVGLIRPLRNSRPHLTHDAPKWAFRVEWTLPFDRDERAGKRPSCCLLGTAVSPLPESGSGKYGLTGPMRHGRPVRARRFRLILHYMDHTILQYYIKGSKQDCDNLDVGII